MENRAQEFTFDYPTGRAVPEFTTYNYNDSYAVREHKVWFEASEKALILFYNEEADVNDKFEVKRNYFWSNMGGRKRHFTHSGLARNIAETMSRILFHNGIEIGAGEKQDELEAILDENKIQHLLNDGAATESWGGRFAYKLSFDPDVSDNVIIDMVEPGAFDVVFKRSRVQELRFYKMFTTREKKMKLIERYGKGYIVYELYDISGREPVRVPLSEAGLVLEDFFFDEKIILAGFKSNKTREGTSDYHGLISEFNSYDEALSGLGNDLRKGSSKSYIPESRLNTNPVTGSTIGLNEFDTEYTVVKDDMAQDARNEITHSQPEIRTNQFTEAADRYEQVILSNVGLNRLTLGLSENIAADAALAVRRQLENATIRTREEKIELWEPFLEEFFATVLKAQAQFKTQTVIEIEVEVDFNEYLQEPPVEYTIDEIAKLLALKLISTDEAREFLGFNENSEIQPTEEPSTEEIEPTDLTE